MGIEGLDRTDLAILRLLQADARLGYSEIGRRVGLSPPAVTQRMRRMEELGTIVGYHAHLSAARLGRPLRCIMRLRTDASRYDEVLATARRLDAVLTCHHVSGDDAFVLEVSARSTEELEGIIGSFSPLGVTSTAIVLSTPVEEVGVPVPDPDGAQR